MKEIYLLSKFDVSSLSMTRDFQTGNFATLSSSKLIAILLSFGKSKLTLIAYLY